MIDVIRTSKERLSDANLEYHAKSGTYDIASMAQELIERRRNETNASPAIEAETFRTALLEIMYRSCSHSQSLNIARAAIGSTATDTNAQKATEPHRAPDPRHCPQCGPHPTESSAEHARAAHTVAGVLADSNREVTAELIQHIVTASETNEALLLGPQSVHNLRWVLNDVLAAAGAPPA